MPETSTGYTVVFTVSQTPAEAFAAIVDPRAWWSSTIEGRADKVGATFTHTHEDAHRCRMEVTELVSGEKVVWHVLENYFSFTKDSSEWTGTDLVFEIKENAAGCAVTFTHVGLVSGFECYDLCTGAWNRAVLGKLQLLIASGTGLSAA